MVLPRTFRNDRERIVASFDWTDLAGGVGYITYSAGAATTSAGTTYFLTRNNTESQSNLINAGVTPVITDFDIEFKSPSRIGGDALLNFTHVAGAAGQSIVTASIVHVTTGAAETVLGTATTPTRAAAANYREMLKIAIGDTHFAIGEKLRLKITHTGSGNQATLYIDPSSGLSLTDSLTRTVGTDFSCDIPFRIDL